MSRDKVFLKPHTSEINNNKDYTMAFDNVIKEQLKLVETYLLEFCEVNGIPESELKNHLVVARYLSDNSVMAVNVDDQRDVKFGTRIKVLHEEKESFDIEFTFEIEIFGEFLEHKDKFPKTLKRIEENGGNIAITSRE